MNFPSAVQGHMPFVDKYKQEQIKRVLEKHRSRHHSGPDHPSSKDRSAKHKNTHSMPILWQSVYTGQRPRFISMSALDDSRVGLNSYQKYSSASQSLASPSTSEKESSKNSKNSLLSSLKKLFSGKKEATEGNSGSTRSHKVRLSGAIVQGNYARSFSAPAGGCSKKLSKKPAADNDVLSGVRSPKRQRMRTISNISGVMETIEEVNEIIASTDRLSDSDESVDGEDYSSSSAVTHRSVESAPELSSTNLFYSCGNLSNFSDSSSSHHGSSDLVQNICVA